MKVIDIPVISDFPPSNIREKLQNILDRKSSKPNDLDSMVWYLQGITLDFGILDQLRHSNRDWWEKRPTNIFFLAKLLFLDVIDQKIGKETIRDAFNALIKTFIYLAKNNIDILKKEHLADYIGYLMMHNIENARLVVGAD
ncbi:MAG TPA: hypothetical protein VIG55_05435 [Methylosinus sp.]|jgi:hypothetical protein